MLMDASGQCSSRDLGKLVLKHLGPKLVTSFPPELQAGLASKQSGLRQVDSKICNHVGAWTVREIISHELKDSLFQQMESKGESVHFSAAPSTY